MELTICILAIFCNIPLFNNDCALHSAFSSKQHNSSTTAIKLKHFESSDRSKLRIRGDVFWNGGFMVKCSQKYTTLQHIDINIVRLQQLSSAVLHLVDAYIRLAPVFRGAKPDKQHLGSCDFLHCPYCKTAHIHKNLAPLISISAAKPDGV